MSLGWKPWAKPWHTCNLAAVAVIVATVVIALAVVAAVTACT